MAKWLAFAALGPLLAAEESRAQTLPPPADPIVIVARSHALDFRLAEERGLYRQAPLMRGMLVQRNVAPNAVVGVGLANIYGRKKGVDPSLNDRPSRTRKPAVTFVMRF
jgi:hypothetical protein